MDEEGNTIDCARYWRKEGEILEREVGCAPWRG